MRLHLALNCRSEGGQGASRGRFMGNALVVVVAAVVS